MYLCILLYMYVNIKTNTKVTPHKYVYMYKVSPRATDQMKKIPKDNGGSDKELAITANNDFY